MQNYMKIYYYITKGTLNEVALKWTRMMIIITFFDNIKLLKYTIYNELS